MKKIMTFFVLLILVVNESKSQAIEYSYDDAGNRYQRKVVYLLHSMPIDSSNTVDEFDGLTVAVTPNPTKDIISVNVTEKSNNENNEKADRNLYLYDNKGTLITSQKISGNNTTVDMASLANGSYLLIIYNGKKKREIRIIKQ